MDGGTLRSVEISSPAIARLVREQRRLAATQMLMLTSWGLLPPLLLLLPFEALLPAQAADAVGYLLAGCLVLGFVLWIPENFFRKRRRKPGTGPSRKWKLPWPRCGPAGSWSGTRRTQASGGNAS